MSKATKQKKEETSKMATMPPEGKENKSMTEVLEEGKPESTKALEAAATVRNATGGQSGEGSSVPVDLGVGDPEGKTVSAKSLANSNQPKAPTHPLQVPDKQDK